MMKNKAGEVDRTDSDKAAFLCQGIFSDEEAFKHDLHLFTWSDYIVVYIYNTNHLCR